MPYQFYELTPKGGVAVVTINRPPSNAMSEELIDELSDLITEILNAKKFRAVLFKSAHPKYFMTGADLKTIPPNLDLGEVDPSLSPMDAMVKMIPKLADHMTPVFQKVHETLNRLETLPMPTVVAINGHALGGGLEFCLACDFRLMARGGGTVGFTEVSLGLLPGAGGTQRLPRVVGRGKAAELILMGRRLTADEAESIGLIYKAVDQDELEEAAEKLAGELSQRATVAIARVKECIYRGTELPFEQGLEMELRSIKELMQTEDLVEGIASFMLKKKPEFKGR